MKYSIEKIDDYFAIIHTEKDGKATIIGTAEDAEKAHFLATAANTYIDPESALDDCFSNEDIQQIAGFDLIEDRVTYLNMKATLYALAILAQQQPGRLEVEFSDPNIQYYKNVINAQNELIKALAPKI